MWNEPLWLGVSKAFLGRFSKQLYMEVVCHCFFWLVFRLLNMQVVLDLQQFVEGWKLQRH